MSAPSFADISTVLFDFGGTLDSNGLPWKDRFRALFREAGVDADAAEFDAAFYAADDALVGRIPASLSYAETVARLGRGVARNLGLADGRVGAQVAARFLRDSLGQLARNARLLAALGDRFRLGLVSNFYGNLETVCGDGGIRPYLDVIVDSARVGHTKPDPEIFRVAFAALGVAPTEALFVGDSLRRDLAGAEAVGMPFVWLRGEGTEARDGPSFNGVALADLGELRRWLP